jgi:hypothetical protein
MILGKISYLLTLKRPARHFSPRSSEVLHMAYSLVRAIRPVLNLTLAFFVVGCDSGGNKQFPAKVTGKITYNGNAVKGGTVAFLPAGASAPLKFSIGADGSYNAPDLPEGPMTVTVETESLNPEKKHETYGGRGGKGPPGGKGPSSYLPAGAVTAATDHYVKIPAKYADPSTSGLSTTLKKGAQTFDIKLTD